MTLRSILDSDLDRLLQLNNDAVPAVGALDRSGMAHLVDESLVALAVDDPSSVEGAAAGFCLVLAPGADYASVNYTWFGDRYDRFVYLDRVVIDPAAKGLGLGRALYERVEQHALEHTDAEWFLLEVNLRPRNDASLAFHDRLGFVEVGQQETPYGALVSLLGKRIR